VAVEALGAKVADPLVMAAASAVAAAASPPVPRPALAMEAAEVVVAAPVLTAVISEQGPAVAMGAVEAVEVVVAVPVLRPALAMEAVEAVEVVVAVPVLRPQHLVWEVLFSVGVVVKGAAVSDPLQLAGMVALVA